MNQLFYGDNLDILRDHIADESVDLIYLDPPFNSKKDYNVLFQEKDGQASPSQIKAFTDTWEWDRNAMAAYDGLVDNGPHNVATMIAAMREFVGGNDMMAYLVMMAQRLVELHRVLKPTGNLFLHCDPTASHYLKILLDTIFDGKNFRNEIVWHYNTGGKGKRTFLRKHDIIFWYSKTDDYVFERDAVALPRTAGTAHLRHGVDEDGREYYEDYSPRKSGKKYRWYLDEGVTPMDVWTDIQALNPAARERLGYPTQKPLPLLQRIITAGSRPGDVVLDPFCGCGTAIVAAQTLGRRWIGIDVTHLSVALMKNRLADAFGETLKYEVKGEPEDVGAAQMLAEADRYEFQRWANSLVKAHPVGGVEKKGADRGIDGIIRFVDEADGKFKRVLVQVKSGKVSSATMRDLIGTLNREKAEMAMLVTLESPTGPMQREAAEAGTYFSPGWNRDFPRVQILTIEDLLSGKRPDVPPMRATFERAARIRAKASHGQQTLFGGD